MESNRRAFLAGLGGLAGGSRCSGPCAANGRPDARVSADSNSGPVKIVQFDDTGKKLGVAHSPEVVKTDEEWRKLLASEQYQVTRHAATERPSNAYSTNITPRGSTAASAATTPCSPRTPNSNPAPAGPASGRPSPRKISLIHRQQPRHVPRRSLLPPLRRSPRPRLRRRPQADRPALLHELRLPPLHPAQKNPENLSHSRSWMCSSIAPCAAAKGAGHLPLVLFTLAPRPRPPRSVSPAT